MAAGTVNVGAVLNTPPMLNAAFGGSIPTPAFRSRPLS